MGENPNHQAGLFAEADVETEKQNNICVALATGLHRNREFPCPSRLLKHAPSGAAWRVIWTGASRCLDAGRVKSALFSSGKKFRARINMKTVRSIALCGVALAASFYFVHAQEIATSDQSVQAMSDTEVMLRALESTTPTPATSLPQAGTYWSAQHAPGTANEWPPLPGDMWGLSAWPMGDGVFLLNDTNLDYDALAAAIEAAQPKLSRSGGGMTPMFSLISSPGNNQVYLTNMVATITNGGTTASFSIAGGTNGFAYDIFSTTNLAETPVYSQWSWLGQGYTGNNYTFTNQPLDYAFYILAIPRQTMVVAWGDDSDGQCDVPAGLTNAIDVAGGYNFSLALKADSTVVAWGDNTFGETTVPAGLTNVTSIAAGGAHVLALLQNGTVVAWGDNANGQTNVPAGLTNVTAIAAGDACSLALRSDGSVVAWGYNYYAQTNVPALGPVSQIAAGVIQGVALLTNSAVTQWGNYSGSPFGWTTKPAGLSNVVSIAAGACHTLAVNANGTVTAWGAGALTSGYNNDGQSIVPTGLSNVAAVAGGYLYSMALQSNGTVVAWGDDVYGETDVPDRLTGVKAISAGGFHGLAVRSGSFAPLILDEPVDQYAIAGATVTFSAYGEGVGGVSYQWQFNSMNIMGATGSSLVLTNVQSTDEGSYQVIISNGAGSVTSDTANFYLVTPPVITWQSLPTNQVCDYGTPLTLAVTVSAPYQANGFPLSYQWQFNGTNIYSSNPTNNTFTAVNAGTYSLSVSNAAGGTNVAWHLGIVYPGAVIGWGASSNGQLNASSQLTNVISLAAGTAHGVVALDNGSVTNWGSYWTGTSFVAVSAPPLLTNALAVAAGSRHDLALKTDGKVVGWGLNDFGQTNVPANATNVIAIAAGGQQSLALLKNRTVMQWGQTNGAVPAGLTNVTAIAAGTNFCLALLSNATVVAWGDNTFGETNVPAGVTNAVAVAAGGSHAMALLQNGTIVSWGDNTFGQTNVPGNLTNAMAIAAGDKNSMALLNNGTVVAWGDNTFGETNPVGGLNDVKLIAAGSQFLLAVQFSPTVMYPVNVSQDLLLIYNTNSIGSTTVENYYLQNRPMVGAANVLGIGCPTNETISSADFTNQILLPYLSWLNQNPTKRPQYLVLFMDIPSIVQDSVSYPSVQYQLYTATANGNPFVTSINMNGNGGTNDCIAYINKLATIGALVSSNSPLLSASKNGYGNTNYILDNVNNLGYSESIVSNAITGLVDAGVQTNSIFYLYGYENGFTLPHLTNAVNVAGYICWGWHSSLGGSYPLNMVQWSGNSGWWIIRTEESFNGQRSGQFLMWFSSNAFGGTNYSNTPIGGPTYVNEPLATATDNQILFNLWASGKNLAICCWVARNPSTPPYLQVVGDPFVKR